MGGKNIVKGKVVKLTNHNGFWKLKINGEYYYIKWEEIPRFEVSIFLQLIDGKEIIGGYTIEKDGKKWLNINKTILKKPQSLF